MPLIGDIVNIYNGKVPRHKQLLGPIYDINIGKDSVIAGEKLFVGKTKNTVERPIIKLYLVEYFNAFIIPFEDENIRQRPILADIKRKFCN